MISPQTEIKLLRDRDWDGLVEEMRRVHLVGDKSVCPYKSAKIESKLVEYSEIFPIAKYVLRSNLEVQEETA